MTVDTETLNERLRGNAFHEDRQFHAEEVEDGRVVLSMPVQDHLTNFSGNLHGGVLATLVDTASALAIRVTYEDPWAPGLATTDLTVSYVRPASGEVRADAEIVRVGGSLAVTEVEVTGVAPDGERKTVAIGGTTYRVFT
jgi:uncharacterized protein (TIGR00369 family)